MDYFDGRQYLVNLPLPVFLVSVKSGKIIYANKRAERVGIFAGINFINMLDDKKTFFLFNKNAGREPREHRLTLKINDKLCDAKLSLYGARFNGIQSWLMTLEALEESNAQNAPMVVSMICDIYTGPADSSKIHDFLALTGNSISAFCATLYEKRNQRYVIKEEWRNRKNVCIPVLCPRFEDNTASEIERIKRLKGAQSMIYAMYKKIFGTEGVIVYCLDHAVDEQIKQNIDRYAAVYKALSPDAPKNNTYALTIKALNSLSQGLAVWNSQTRDLLYDNKAYRELLGYKCSAKMNGKLGAKLRYDKKQQESLSDAKGNDYIVTHTMTRVNGQEMVATLINDITVYKKAENKLDLMAKTDALTGLLNRRAGIEMLSSIYEKCKEENRPLTVCFADIDGLKFINDTYGHGAGDVMIRSVADVLQKYVGNIGTACRLGGDEFVLILPGINKQQAQLLTAQIDRDASSCLVGQSQGISMSFGFKEAEYTAQETVNTLVSIADNDMYQEKRKKSVK